MREDERERDDHLSLSEEGDRAEAARLLGRSRLAAHVSDDVAGALIQIHDEQRDRIGCAKAYLGRVLANLLKDPAEVRSALLRRRSARETAATARAEGHRRAAAEDAARARKAELWDRVVAMPLEERIQTAQELGCDSRVSVGLTPLEPDGWAVGALVDALDARDRRAAERAAAGQADPPPIRFRRPRGARRDRPRDESPPRAGDLAAELRRKVGP